MLDPQAIEFIVGLVFIGFFVLFIVCLFYGLFLLAKIRSQAVRINKNLEVLLAKSAEGSTTTGEPKTL